MTLTEQVYAQAVLMAGSEVEVQEALLQVFCQSATNSLTAQLREGLTPEDCKADFVAAASLYALAALAEVDELSDFSHIQVGDVTMKRGGGAATACLRNQARLMMTPYLADDFVFRGI